MRFSALSPGMAGEDATDRVRARLRELFEQKRFKQNRVAERLAIQPSAVTRYVNGPTPITVAFLEAVSEESAIPIGELVAPVESWKQVSADEAAILRGLRKWPTSVTTSLVRFLAFFVDEAPSAGMLRNLHELLRELPEPARRAVYGFALMRKEGAIPPELEAELFAQLSSAAQAALEPSGQTRRRRTK